MAWYNSLTEQIKYFLQPEIVDKIQKPVEEFDEEKQKEKGKTTEFGSFDDVDALDVDTVSSTSYSTVFQLDKPDDKTLNDLIRRYRYVGQMSYVNDALDEIVNESIYKSELPDNPVTITYNDPQNKLKDTVKERISDEFQKLLDIMDFDDMGDSYFRQWYVDGRLLLQIVLDKNHLEKGIQKVKMMSPLNLKRNWDPTEKVFTYVYDSESIKMEDGRDAVLVVPDELMIFVPSGIYEGEKKIPISYLQTALKDINRLDTLEDHFLIYRIVRSPERRVFYIDAGNLPPKKAEQYLKQVINTYKQKKVYNETTGTLVSKNKHPSILEDFFLLRRNGKGTEIDTLSSVGDLGSIEDLLYFQRKAAKALHVPFGRLNSEDRQGSNIVMPTGNEITREELKFSKFIRKVQGKFNKLFSEILKKQLIYKKLIKAEEWMSIKRKLVFVYRSDTRFAQAKRHSNMQQQLDILSSADDYIGKWFSRDDVYKKILGKTDDEIREFEQRLAEEQAKYGDSEDDASEGMF